MSDRCSEVEGKMNTFIQANNVELARFSDSVDDLSKAFREYITRAEEYKRSRELEEKQFRAEMKPLLDWYQGMTFSKKLFWGGVAGVGALFGITASILGIIYTIKKLLE